MMLYIVAETSEKSLLFGLKIRETFSNGEVFICSRSEQIKNDLLEWPMNTVSYTISGEISTENLKRNLE